MELIDLIYIIPLTFCASATLSHAVFSMDVSAESIIVDLALSCTPGFNIVMAYKILLNKWSFE
jgi:hypothetical protein